MDADEAQELKERQEEAARDKGSRGVALQMSTLAVLVAISTLLGHRAANEAVLAQARASDTWNEYQAKRVRQSDTLLISDLLAVLPLQDSAKAGTLIARYGKHSAKWNAEVQQESAQAHELEREVRRAERREDRYDLGEALLEIGLVITSISLLTRRIVYAWLGGGFGIAGIASAALGLFLR
jgi:hypothetical protein